MTEQGEQVAKLLRYVGEAVRRIEEKHQVEEQGYLNILSYINCAGGVKG